MESRFFAPTRSITKPARAGAVKVGRRPNLAAYSALARPHLDCSEHDGTLGAVGMTIRGEPAFPGADQSRHDLVSGGSMTRTMTHSCASAAKLQGGGPILFPGMKAKGAIGTPPPRTVIGTPSRLKRGGPKLSKDFYATPLIKLDAGRHPPGSRPPARAATGRSAACVPAPQSLSCGSGAHSSCVRKTNAPRRYPSGTSETAMPVGSCRAGLARYRIEPTLSRDASCRSRQASR